MWHLISTWNRHDGSTTVWYSFDEPRLRRWMRYRRQRSNRRRSDRDRRRRAHDPTVGGRVIDAIGQVVARHGLAAASPPDSDDVVWCTATDDVSLVDDERCDSSDPAPCVDLWVHVDQRRREIAVDFEGRGLHEHLTGTTHWDGADPFPLAGDLDRSLALLAGHIDRWFGAIIQRR